MTLDRLRAWTRQHRWALLFVLVVSAGYTLGKDMALRDNAVARQSAAR